MYKLDEAYEVKFTRVYYQQNTSLAYTPRGSRNYDTVDRTFIVSNVLGEEMYRNTSVYNKVLSFYYYTQNDKVLDASEYFNKVNSYDISIAGISIPKYKGLLLEYTVNVVNLDLKHPTKDEFIPIDVCKVTVLIEIEVEKPLYQVPVPLKGYYFKHPKTGRKTRIQFSSCPEVYLNNKSAYPYAYEACRGLGFYSEDRPDLNIAEPVFLTIEGGILDDLENPEFIMCNEKRAISWKALSMPSKMGVTEEEAF